MSKLQGFAILAMGAAMIPAAFCQTVSSSESPSAQDKQETQANAVPMIAVENQATPDQIERLFTVMRVRHQTESLIQQMSTMMQQQIAQGMKSDEANMPDSKKPTPEQSAARQELMAKFMDQAMHLYTVDEMLADMTPIYQRHMSKDDVEAFIAFFGSSSGQHLLDQQPLIVKEYMPVVMNRVQEKSKALTEELKKDLEDLKAKENTDSTKAPKQ